MKSPRGGRNGHAIPASGILLTTKMINEIDRQASRECTRFHLYTKSREGLAPPVIDRLRRLYNTGRFVRLPEHNQTYCRGERTRRIRNLLWRLAWQRRRRRARAREQTPTQKPGAPFGKVSCYPAILIPAIKNWTSEK